MSVSAAVATTLAVGALLDVDVETRGNFLVVVCKLPGTNTVVGAIAGVPRLDELIKCIQAGVRYSAEVVARTGANVRVRVWRTGP